MSNATCRKRCACRPGRPNCRVSRHKWRKPCQCDGYHYPHRPKSALCESHPKAQEKRNVILYGRTA